MSETSEFKAELVAEDGTRHALEGEQTVGRSPDCGITIEDSRVSRKHAVIKVEGERVTVEDQGSANGTLVNGQKITAATPLSNGDTLKFDKHQFTVEISGLEEEEEDMDATVVDMAPISLPEDDDVTVVSPIPEPPPPPAAPPPPSPGAASGLPGSWAEDDEGEHTQVMGMDAAAAATPAPKKEMARMSDLPHLIMLSSAGAPQGAMELQPGAGPDPDVWEIGREPGCEIVLAEPSVSGRHAQLIHQGGRWRLVNLVSANGIFVNGEKRLSAFLSDGDVVRLGHASMVFHGPVGGVAAAPAAAARASAGSTAGGGKSRTLLIGGIVAVVVIAAAAAAFFLL